ncbi:MAG: DUF6531 domain-containing protein [Candidatus Thiodiazotropha sp. LLP2]
MRWYAYPTTDPQGFSTQQDAVLDFQSKGPPYSQSTEALPPVYYDTYKVIHYKIPDLPVEVTDWVYRYSGSGQDEGFTSESEAFSSMQSGYFDLVPPYCGAVVGGVSKSGWVTNISTYGRPVSETNTHEFNLWSGDYYIHWPDNYKECTLDVTETKYISRFRSVRCTLGVYDAVQDICKGDTYARVTGYGKYFMVEKPRICPIDGNPIEGNPCSPANGNKTQTETDYSSTKSNLKVQRYYSSQGIGDGYNELGSRWRHNYSHRLDGYQEPAYTAYKGQKTELYDTPREACVSGWSELKGSLNNGLLSDARALYSGGVCKIQKNFITVMKLLIHSTLDGRKDSGTSAKIRTFTRGKGDSYAFSFTNNEWQPLFPSQHRIEKTDSGWIYQVPNGVTENYDNEGNLLSSEDSAHLMTAFTYNDQGRLAEVTGAFGDTLTYHYNESGNLIRITTPDGDLKYHYDSEDRLSRVVNTDNSERIYHYENPEYPHHLTGITDENTNRFATWEYDDEGRAILSEHANGAEQVSFIYNPDGTTTVTDAAGAERIYHFVVQQGAMKVDHIEGDRCTTCAGGDTQAYTYDNNGFIASKTDWNGNTTTYTRDNHGRELSRTEASGTPQARTITTTWDTDINKPLVITEPNQITEYTYDSKGRLQSKRQTPSE